MNKYLLAVVAVSVSCLGHLAAAGECTNAQWAEANSDQGHLAVQNQLEADSVFFPMTDLCIDGNSIRPKDGSDFTVGDGSEDSPFRAVHWSLPLKGETSQCVYADDSAENCDWQNVATEIPTSGKLSVVDMSLETPTEVCTKSYSIPACK